MTPPTEQAVERARDAQPPTSAPDLMAALKASLSRDAQPPTCDGCWVREPFEHRCHGLPCGCEECREVDSLFGPQPPTDNDCQHDSWSGDEGPIARLGRWPVRWRCDGCGLVRTDNPPAVPAGDAKGAK